MYTPFPILNQFVVPCLVLTVVSWHAYRFLRRQVRCSGTPISLRIFQFVVIHMVSGFSIVSEEKVDIFLEISCFFYDPTHVGNLISVFSAFLSPACTSGSFLFKYYWILAWTFPALLSFTRIKGIYLLPCYTQSPVSHGYHNLQRPLGCATALLSLLPTHISPG